MRLSFFSFLFLGGISFSQNTHELHSDSVSTKLEIPVDTCSIYFNWNADNPCAPKTPSTPPHLTSVDSLGTIYIANILDCQGPDCRLVILPECVVQSYTVTIFNRWGEVLYESNNPGDVWCPSGNPEGVYIWQFEGIYPNGTPFKRRGHFTLLFYFSEE